MKVNKLEKIDLDIYEETLKNGLRIYIIPKENVNGIYVTFTTKFGSVNQEFIPIGNNDFIKVPLGIAHFLEHKMFEQKDDIDPFTFYSERGCDANANTSNFKTTYLFSGANSFNENLNFLLNYVQSPYFTDKNVEKEKGIIEQEIKMYKDDPYYRMYDGIVFNSFKCHPIKYPIAGTIEEVNKITKEDLYTCYNTFYHPSNMFIVVTGNVDPEDTIDLIRINQEKKKFDKFNKIVLKEYGEPDEVEKEKEEISMNIEIEKMGIGYKFSFSKSKKNINDIRNYIGTLFDLKFGSTSKLSEKLKEEGLVTSGIDITIINTDKHILAILMFESKNVERVEKLINKELRDLSITLDDLNRKIKVRKSNCIYRSDSIYSLNSKIVSNIINYDKIIYDDYKKIEETNIDTMKKIIKNLDFSNKTVYVIHKS